MEHHPTDRDREIVSRMAADLREVGCPAGVDRAFVNALFMRNPSEDLERYGPESLGAIACHAWQILSRHVPGDRTVLVDDFRVGVVPRDGMHTNLTSITVVVDDTPFLLDSIMGELTARSLKIQLVLHPVLDRTVWTGSDGRETSIIVIHIDPIDPPEERIALESAIHRILDAVNAAVNDRSAMFEKVSCCLEALRAHPRTLVDQGEIDEAIHFLQWLINDNFIFIGTRDYYIHEGDCGGTLVGKDGFGILRDPQLQVLRHGREMVAFTPELREFLKRGSPLIITKANVRSLVHRRVHLDYIGVKIFSETGEGIGEVRIVGLFSAAAYTGSVHSIPFLRRKVQTLFGEIGFDPDSHPSRILDNVLENYPRDELFQIDGDLLSRFAVSIMHLQEHPRLRVLPRIDKFDRFVSVLVFIPRDRFSTNIRIKIGQHLANRYSGRISAFYPTFLEGSLVRVHYIIGHDEGIIPRIESADLEAEISTLIRDWSDNLRDIMNTHGADIPSAATSLYSRYKNAFPPDYQNQFDGIEALRDIRAIEKLLADTQNFIGILETRTEFVPTETGSHRILKFRLFSRQNPIALSDRVPIIENMGFKIISEYTYVITPEQQRIHLHHIFLTSSASESQIRPVSPSTLSRIHEILAPINAHRHEACRISPAQLLECILLGHDDPGDPRGTVLNTFRDYIKGISDTVHCRIDSESEYLFDLITGWASHNPDLSLPASGEHLCHRIFREYQKPGLRDSLFPEFATHMAACKNDRLLSTDAFLSCFAAVFLGHAQDDGYNHLVTQAGLEWRDIAILRSYSRFLRQIPLPYDQKDMWEALRKYPHIATALVRLFHQTFDPFVEISPTERREMSEQSLNAIETALQGVEVLSEDRIIRLFTRLILATLRCNFFQRRPLSAGTKSSPASSGRQCNFAHLEGDARGLFPPAMAFKIDSSRIDDLPEPRPFAEIWVYSPRVEGVHLRFGRVARGGLRWSDRAQDFRTEVLGLVKAQQVKNAVIVPVGAKGGFVAKYLPAHEGQRDAIQREGCAAYEIFVSCMLDITDNLHENVVVPPDHIVRHDGDDPYLVVAADKGTATFSDLANTIAAEHGFWLGDAFASGGAAGYDHKKMGITARGAWEAVKRHFREMGRDIQSSPFTVIGIGDMSGDVFGNGMMLSPFTRLIAAFDHRHIFIDPDPDIEKSFAERTRLFHIGPSSWQDYDRSIISPGGGIFSRREKSIPLSPAMKALTGIESNVTTPFLLIHALLMADVDLIWFGGVGTYVRSSEERNESVGDRANDELRVTADRLRAKVIGEGANLGITQCGRIQFAQAGGRINTDAIDNSGGVNSSDLEVNIKIALGHSLRTGSLSPADRNTLLEEMTQDVAALVLRNNYLQTLSISLSERQGTHNTPFQKRLMQNLEQSGSLNRKIEYLPDDPTIVKRIQAKQPLCRPELAVLIAYAKINIFNALIASDLPDDPYLDKELLLYFPKSMQQEHADAIRQHRLRREIIATSLANSVANHGGLDFAVRVHEHTNAPTTSVVRAFVITRDAFGLISLGEDIDALDNQIDIHLQMSLYEKISGMLFDQTLWFLDHISFDSGTALADIVRTYTDGIVVLFNAFDRLLPERMVEEFILGCNTLEKRHVPAATARKIMALDILAWGPDIVRISIDMPHRSITEVATVFFAIASETQIDWLREKNRSISVVEKFARLAVNDISDRLSRVQRQITRQILERDGSVEDALSFWKETHAGALQDVSSLVAEFQAENQGEPDIPKLVVVTGILAKVAFS